MVALPQDFVKRIKADTFWNDDLIEAFNHEPPTSIRLNPKKNGDFSFLESVPWNKNGYYLPKRPVFTTDPLFHAGCYYPQEAGSMVIENILEILSVP
ncbi:MAG: RNA methyltransferase, partial [Bacteroidetes bacterium]|nr:RNA methyltransferase [Bacteroidota bacterium]